MINRLQTGILKSIDIDNYQATIEIGGMVFSGIPIARNMAIEELQEGRRVLLTSPGNIADTCVIAVWQNASGGTYQSRRNLSGVDWEDAGVDWGSVLPQAVQGYFHDIGFTASDWNEITMTPGTIKFYDGTTQAIDYLVASPEIVYTLPDDDVYYFYFDLDDDNPNILKVIAADDYLSSAFSTKTSVLCVVQRSSDEDTLAIVLPGREKQPLIVTDMIHMAGLREWTDPVTGFRYQQISDLDMESGHLKISSITSYAAGYNPSEKRRVFTTTPTTPYDVGDLWFDNANVKRCTNARASGAYQAGDWTATTLDAIVNGSEFARVRITDLSDGHLKLTSATVIDGEWYNESGVLMDAGKGVRCYGTDMAFGTFANLSDAQAGTNWKTKMASDGSFMAAGGSIILDDANLKVIGSALKLQDSLEAKTAYIYEGGTGNLNIYNQSGAIVLNPASPYEVLPYGGGCKFGNISDFWGDVVTFMVTLKEYGGTPPSETDFGRIYTDSDNKLHFIDGDGNSSAMAKESQLHDRQHSITSTDDHTSGATSGKMLKANADGLPIDASNTDTEVADAVSKKHDRQHALNSGDDHTGRASLSQMPTGTDGYVLTAKGAGVDPVYEAISAGLSAAKGNYTGNGTQNRAITHGLGIKPKIVFIASNDNVDDHKGWIMDGLAEEVNFAGYSDSVTEMTSTYFYVGYWTDGERFNDNGVAYHWVAIG